MSLGNRFPPQHVNTKHMQAEAKIRGINPDELQKLTLLSEFRDLCEAILQDGRFRQVVFLPQLHVLTWANKAQV
jgi:hypothetical protein